MNTDGQSSADVRWRIVDLDAKFRAAAKTGILEGVFTKERKCLVSERFL
jgi:hypothetical protein